MNTPTCILVAMLSMVWPAAAIALDITFDDVQSVGNPAVTALDTHWYRFAGSFRTIDLPGGSLASNGSAVYLGQEASAPAITVTRVDGGPFALYEFDAAGLHLSPPAGSPNAQQVSLVGFRTGGGVLSALYGLDTLVSFTHYSVPASWYDLQAVTFAGLRFATTPGALALDNVGVGEGPVPTPVPEAATLTLAVLTALGAGTMALVRRR
ncbi:MAG: hypothetical protein WEG40_13325 [Candidatus Rokuibacteriota bacterium]